jgi:hypothetical protein
MTAIDKAIDSQHHSAGKPYRVSRHIKKAIPKVDHFQLRNLFATSSQHDAFYANRWQVYHVDPSDPPGTAKEAKSIIDLENPNSTDTYGLLLTTLELGHQNILMTGSFDGTYTLTDLNNTSPSTISKACPNEMINHISISPTHVHPTATIATNDPSRTLVSLDLHRNDLRTINFPTSNDKVPAIINATAPSPCGRLQLAIGDFAGALLLDSRAPSVLGSLDTSPLPGFAAAWAHDSWHVATASDAGEVLLWDARMWHVIRRLDTIMAPVRSMKFSGPGAGPVTLFAAESYDFLHILDAASAEEVQTAHFFGEVGGLAVSSDGEEVMIANADPMFGGITVWERQRENMVRERDGRNERVWWLFNDDDDDDVL